MRKNQTISVLTLFAVLLLFALSGSNSARAQVATDFYGQATLLPNGQESGNTYTGPTGSAQFYRVGDAANSTRVVVQVENMPSYPLYVPFILSGSCQGDVLVPLNQLNMDRSGKG